jgi:spore germination protein KC
VKLRRAAARCPIALLLSVALATGATGCWNAAEIESLAFITAAGLDLDPATGQLLLTVRIVKPEAMAGGALTGHTREKCFWTASYAARTVFEAWRGMLQMSPKRMFAAHLRILVLGEGLARQGVFQVLDFFARDGETRRTIHVLVARGATAQRFLESEYELGEAPDEMLHSQLHAVSARLSTTAVATLNDVLIAMETPGAEVAVTPAGLIEKAPGEPVGQVERTEITASPMIGGAAVFQGDRLAGFLEPLEARGLLWATGRVRSTLVVVENPGAAGEYASLEIQHAKGRIKPEIDGQDLSFGIHVEVQAALGEAQTPVNPELWPAYARELEARLAATIRAEIDTALLRCREWNGDAFGLGAAVYRSAPAFWREIESGWPDMFTTVPVSVEVGAQVVRSGVQVRTQAK